MCNRDFSAAMCLVVIDFSRSVRLNTDPAGWRRRRR
jgi:hypothetical protein